MTKIFFLSLCLLFTSVNCRAFEFGMGETSSATIISLLDSIFWRLDNTNDGSIVNDLDIPVPHVTIGGSTLAVINGQVGIGTTDPLTLFDIKSLFNVNTAGDVGIGITNPSRRLYIVDNIAQSVVMIQNLSVSGWSAIDFIKSGGGTGAGFGYGNASVNEPEKTRGYFYTTSGVDLIIHYSSNTVNFDSGGSVGFGDIMSPQKPIHMVGEIRSSSATIDGGDYTDFGHDGADFVIDTNAGDIVLTGGNVGISDASPDYRFDVNGDAYVSSSMTVAGGLFVSNSSITISTTCGDYGIRFQDKSYQNKAWYHIEASSSPSHTSDIASTSYVGLSTIPITMKGGLSYKVTLSLLIDNDTAGRTYTMAFAVDGVIQKEISYDTPVNSSLVVSPTNHIVSSPAGAKNFSFWIKSDNGGGTQTCKVYTFLVEEYNNSE